MNDQFAGKWDDYFAAIEHATPTVNALGLTDYCSLRGYKEFKTRRAGRVAHVELLFPNVELRLSVETRTGKGINLHLLVSPEDPDHVARAEEMLGRLEFTYQQEKFPCSDASLMRLGRCQPGKASLPDDAALREGAGQFKVEFSSVRDLFKDAWVKRNVLLAIAAGQDGLAGLGQDSGFRALREELGRTVDVVFSSAESDRSYWLGGHADFQRNKQTPKPCIHGSDAHALIKVLQPDLDRRTWIKGGTTFESLRQTLAEPERRVFIGPQPPSGSPTTESIRQVAFGNTPWLTQGSLTLNPGLVTVIGMKGSGKTALADLVALATGAEDEPSGPASFVGKARQFLKGSTVELTWGDGSVTTREVADSPTPQPDPRAQYLSQQFVDRLAAPNDISEPLVAEIERVVFEAIPNEDRLQTTSFQDLRRVLLADPNAAQAHERDIIRAQTRVVAEEQAIEKSIAQLRATLATAERSRKGTEAEIAKIPAPAGATAAAAVATAASSLQARRDAIAAVELRRTRLADVLADVDRRLSANVDAWEQLRERYAGLLDTPIWDLLKPRIDEEGRLRIEQLMASAAQEVANLKTGTLVGPKGHPVPSLQDLISAHDQLFTKLGLDETNQRRRLDFERRLVDAKAEEAKAAAAVTTALAAPTRRRAASQKRLGAYKRVFDALQDEMSRYQSLYKPLQDRVRLDPRLSKFAVVVRRSVDLDSWARRGEDLFDLRTGPFAGRGSLAAAARAELLGPWQDGTPNQVERALAGFIEHHLTATRPALALGVSGMEVGEWLFSTDHVRVQYSIQYENVPISRLSPGTRGVVLLTLYLGLDTWDLRPLLIDQPEENLDPSSVYGSLVPFFRDAALRRQIIMVTHNANLVVNTDSDQVIVAEAKRPSTKRLPDVTYLAGGLEDPEIRERVCALLEGGRDAFRRRDQRYGPQPS
jgi:energy-coupling factor transporter ATP-binding protein EcfA2